MNKLLSGIRRVLTALPWQVRFLSRGTRHEENCYVYAAGPVNERLGSVPRGLLAVSEFTGNTRTNLLVVHALSRQRETWRESKLNRGE